MKRFGASIDCHHGNSDSSGDVIMDDLSSIASSEITVKSGREVAQMVASRNNKSKLPFKKRHKKGNLTNNENTNKDKDSSDIVPLVGAIDDQRCKLGRMEKTLDLIYKKLKLHEDNIDALQEKLYLIEYGTPGTFFATVRFYFALFKCTMVPIIVVEVFYRVLFG